MGAAQQVGRANHQNDAPVAPNAHATEGTTVDIPGIGSVTLNVVCKSARSSARSSTGPPPGGSAAGPPPKEPLGPPPGPPPPGPPPPNTAGHDVPAEPAEPPFPPAWAAGSSTPNAGYLRPCLSCGQTSYFREYICSTPTVPMHGCAFYVGIVRGWIS